MSTLGQPQYKAWVDRGGNIGIQCLVCYRTHWDKNQPATDPITKEPCANCEGIKSTAIFDAENTKHREEKEDDVCPHYPSQSLV